MLASRRFSRRQIPGSVCGVQLPANLKDCQKLPEPIYTPSTKAEIGLHDEVSSEVCVVFVASIDCRVLRGRILRSSKQRS